MSHASASGNQEILDRTVDDYVGSKDMIGLFLSSLSSEFYIATKCGGSPKCHVWTKENCLSTMEESLRRLRTDCVDIMQLHGPSGEECEQGTLVEALMEMKEKGKTRWIGASTTLPHLPTYLEWGVFDAFQIPYSALERDHEGWISKSAEAGVGIIIRRGVARGEPDIGEGSVDQ